MSVLKTMSKLTDKFCFHQYAEIIKNPKSHDEIRQLIDEHAPPLKDFISGLDELYGIDAVMRATAVLMLLLNCDQQNGNGVEPSNN